MDNPKLEKEMAIEELTKGLYLMAQLWFDVNDESEVVSELCDGVMGALKAGLSSLKSIDKPAGSQDFENSNPKKNEGSRNGFKRSRSEDPNPRVKTKRSELNLKKIITDSPFDEYLWRKYGQKKIRNAEHPRCYYRCSYEGCRAKKLVQQKSNGDLPKYEVAFKYEHTCNPSRVSIPQLIVPSPDHLGSEIISFELNNSYPGHSGNFSSSMNLTTTDDPIFSAPPSPAGQFYATDHTSAYNVDEYFSKPQDVNWP